MPMIYPRPLDVVDSMAMPVLTTVLIYSEESLQVGSGSKCEHHRGLNLKR